MIILLDDSTSMRRLIFGSDVLPHRLEDSVVAIIRKAAAIAEREQDDRIKPEHLLAGLVRLSCGGRSVLCGLLLHQEEQYHDRAVRSLIRAFGRRSGGQKSAKCRKWVISKSAFKVLRGCVREARRLKCPIVDSIHLALSILRNCPPALRQAQRLHGISYNAMYSEASELCGVANG